MPRFTLLFCGLLALASSLATPLASPWSPAQAAAADPPLVVETPLSPPTWALLQRELLAAADDGCRQFFERYFDDRGYLLCVERWGGDDGPDDAIENCNDWPLLHALGGSPQTLELFQRAYEGHLRQYTLARTTQVPMARDGMYYREFPVAMDWLHNAEGLTAFNLLGLSTPHDPRFRQRVERFARFYTGADPQAPNYDPQHRVIRSLFNGSRGPLLRPATPLDWAGDPIEIAGRFRPGHGERSYEEMLLHFQDYTDIVGDHPQNLLATSLAVNAWLLTGDDRYRQWVLEYVNAWTSRARANGHILPSKVGPDGTVGPDWFGNVYGWGFTVFDPATQRPAHRNTVYLGVVGFLNAMFLSGDAQHLDTWRRQIDAVNAQSRVVNGQPQYPRMCNADGWYDFRPTPADFGLLELACLAWRPADLEPVASHEWLQFLAGRDPAWPERTLRQDLEQVRQRVAGLVADNSTPDTRLSDDSLRFNPARIDSLVCQMLGGLPPGNRGQPLFCSLRYFDPATRRAGLPPGVAALVERQSADQLTVTLVNTLPTQPRELLLQGGAYAEHRLSTVAVGDAPARPLTNPCLRIRLEPGCGATLQFRINRFARPGSLTFPWDRLD